MKIAPIVRSLKTRNNNGIEWKIVHTGQHYDFDMSQSFFEELEIPKPDLFLGAGSGSHAEQTAKIMVEFEKVCLVEKPDFIIVVGDVNSTLACSVVAKKLMIAVAHVEAGLRSFDLTMPEEINRMVTDAISDYFFVTEKSAVKNLLKEGKPEDRIFFVGHVMVDNLFYQLKKLDRDDQEALSTYRIKKDLKKYAFLTLHRPSNVDSSETFDEIVDALNQISVEMPIVFPIHPRTRKKIEKFNLKLSDRIFLLPPLGFKDSLFLWKDASLVMTDSGGLQEETTALGIPCFTIRNNTERPITITEGTNILVGATKEGILSTFGRFKNGFRKEGKVPELWDGKAAERIVDKLISLYATRQFWVI
jgi:UDP-N-acetylglucosamine 2-epimerase (non-hydrolysing)